jgi:hypothetical protein
MDELHSCPLRQIPAADVWYANHECSHCGSVHPAHVAELVAGGAPCGIESGEAWVQDGEFRRPVRTEHMTEEQLAAFHAAMDKPE